MINVEDVKNKIRNVLKERGPSLPIHLARSVELSPVFTSAILSEMMDDRSIKTSSLKIGSSPLYLLQGQEQQLENFSDNLSGVEKDAFMKLRDKKVLKDASQPAPLRAALRGLKDFAIPFKHQEALYWRYAFTSEEEIKMLLDNSQKQEGNQEQRHAKEAEVEKEQEQIQKESHEDKNLIQVAKKPKKQGKQTNSQFLEEIRDYLLGRDIELLEEIEVSSKQVVGKVRINSDLGKITLLMTAKDKKKPNIGDLRTACHKAQEYKMPCYFLSRGEPSKNAYEFVNDNKNLLKLDVLP
ncbi:MAG: hypothetical protein ACP5D2_03365 [Candidatus Nanoarchaeia archaeon]